MLESDYGLDSTCTYELSMRLRRVNLNISSPIYALDTQVNRCLCVMRPIVISPTLGNAFIVMRAALLALYHH